MKSTSKQLLQFGIAGSLNTTACYALYVLFLQFLSYPYAYSFAFMSGVMVGYVLNARWVFAKPPTVKSALGYPLIYIIQYLIGLVLLSFLIETLKVSSFIAPLIVTLCVVPPTFLLIQYVFNEKGPHATTNRS